jgi:hypothetical protein
MELGILSCKTPVFNDCLQKRMRINDRNDKNDNLLYLLIFYKVLIL